MNPTSVRPRRSTLPAGLALGLAAMLALLTAPSVSAIVLPTAWTVTATPMTLGEGVTTPVTVTVTGGTDPIGAIVVTVPAGFTVYGANVLSVPAGTSWTASRAGSSPATVTFAATTPGALTLLAVATFRIRVMATTAPLAAWTVGGYEGTNGGTPSAGLPVPPLDPFVIVPSPTLSPTPSPTLTATPSPTDTATPTPTPTRSMSITPAASPTPAPTTAAATPTPPPTATPRGRTPAPDGTPRPSPTHVQPSASPTPSPSASATAVAIAGGGPISGPAAGSGTRGGGGVTVGGPLDGTVALGDLGSVDALTFAWLVPGALLGLPGLLILLVLAAQAGLGALVVPLTRRIFVERTAAAPTGRAQ